MKKWLVTLLIALLALPFDAAAEESFPELSRRVPHFVSRLRSGRWEARYSLVIGELSGRDAETKRALEELVRDSNPAVANQALVRYVLSFLRVDRSLFRPAFYLPGRFPLADLPPEDPNRALVDYCLGRRKITPRNGWGDCTVPPVPVLDAARLDEPRAAESLTIVGLLGTADDAEALCPFFESPNPAVAIGAATAVIRLGKEQRGVQALLEIAERDPVQHLFYVTEALRILHELNCPRLEPVVRRVLAKIDRTPRMHPGWVSQFLVVAADIVGDSVWSPPAGSGTAAEPK